MRSWLSVLVGVSLLAGCVTQTSSVTRNKPNVRSEVNNQDAAKTRITLALQYLRAGNNSQAKFNLEKALQLAPDLPQGHYSMAYYYEQVGEAQRADKAYQKALNLEPNNPNTLNNYGAFLCRIGRYEVASEQFFKAIDVPSYLRVSSSYENLALCAIKQDNFSQAQDYLNSAIAHDGRSQSALISLAALFYAKSDLHQALGVLKNYADKGFISARSLLLEHLLHASMGHLQKAQELADLLIQTYPDSYQAQVLIANTLEKSEFVRLKEQYRVAQLKRITQKSPAHMSMQPQIKIKRKTPSEMTQPSRLDKRVSSASVSLKPQPQFTADSDKETNIVQQQASTVSQEKPIETALTSNSSGQVRFYEPDPSEVRFKPNSGVLVQQPQVQRNVSLHSLPLLNEDVRTPKVPYHVLEFGENLFSLSVKYDIKLAKLLQWNNLKESDKVVAGQKIYLNNPAITHAIQAGDTLLKIATQHGLLIDDLMRWNKLTPDVALQEGHGILIVDPDSYVL
jgi:type IV pilus assembly protein PilF